VKYEVRQKKVILGHRGLLELSDIGKGVTENMCSQLHLRCITFERRRCLPEKGLGDQLIWPVWFCDILRGSTRVAGLVL